VTDSILDQAILNEQTVILTAGITCLVLPAFMILYRATRETYPGFGLWTTAFVLNGIGSLLLGAQAYLSYWSSLWLGNVMILAFPLFLCLGLLVFLGRKISWGLFGGSLLIYAALQFYFLLLPDTVSLRSVMFSVFVFTYVALFGWGVYRYLPEVLGKPDRLSLAVVALTISVPILRMLNYGIEGAYDSPVFFKDVDTFLILMMVLSSVAMVIAVLSMNAQRLEWDLRMTSDQLAEKTDQLEALNEELVRTSNTDFLTGMSNRRHFDEMFKAAWDTPFDPDEPLSLLVIDVDCFKYYNDTLGHVAGDSCLQRLAHLLIDYHHFESCPKARIGGEEFVVLMREPLEVALSKAEKLVGTMKQLAIPHPTSEVSPMVTISVGVASRRPEDDNRSRLLSRADRALYLAKDTGRDRALAA
jgi:diguanylate cyclase (GGDEF)-like protein